MLGIVQKTVVSVALFCAASAEAATITVRGSDCQRLVQHHKPGAADYVPGVDVSGKPVVSADVGGGYAMAMPEAIDIQIGVDLADRLARRDARKSNPQTPQDQVRRKVMPFEGKAALGTLTIQGRDAFWNGEPLLPQDQAVLAEACRDALTTGEVGAVLPTRKP